MRAAILSALSFCAALFSTTLAFASGHGPVFGYATPTNSQGEWSVDLGVAGRNSEAGSDTSMRAMLSYGFTPHLMFSVIAPAALTKAASTPTRLMSGHDFESDLSWRFHHNPSKVGTRFESTAFGGVLMPGADSTSGIMGQLKRAPGFTAGGGPGTLLPRERVRWVLNFSYFIFQHGHQH